MIGLLPDESMRAPGQGACGTPAIWKSAALEKNIPALAAGNFLLTLRALSGGVKNANLHEIDAAAILTILLVSALARSCDRADGLWSRHAAVRE
jgi:hypothetical protein